MKKKKPVRVQIKILCDIICIIYKICVYIYIYNFQVGHMFTLLYVRNIYIVINFLQPKLLYP